MNGPTVKPKSLLYRAQWIFLVVSIIPLMVLAYLCVQFVFPFMREQGQTMLINSIYVTLGLTVLLAVLGYIISRKTTVATIRTIQDANSQLSSLLDVANKLSRTRMMDRVLEEATRSAVRLLKADAGLVYLLEENHLYCKYAKGVSLSKTDQLFYEMGEGFPGRAADTKKTIWVKNARDDSFFVDRLKSLANFQTGCVLCYPMIYQKRVVGVMELLRESGKEDFDPAGRQIIEILGQQAVSTIMNAEYHEAQQNFFAHVTELLRLSMEKSILWEGHLHHVTTYSNLISRKLNLDEEVRKAIHFAAMFHDIGFLKIGPVAELAASGKTEDKIREHPALGAQYVEPIIVWKHVAPLILNHHEHCDGSGYPTGLTRNQIPIGSRIICVAEAFDTMVNPKSYVETQSEEQAVRDLKKHAGSRYDEKVVEAFLEVLKEEADKEKI